MSVWGASFYDTLLSKNNFYGSFVLEEQETNETFLCFFFFFFADVDDYILY